MPKSDSLEIEFSISNASTNTSEKSKAVYFAHLRETKPQTVHYTHLDEAIGSGEVSWESYKKITAKVGNLLLGPRIFAYMARLLAEDGVVDLNITMSDPLFNELHESHSKRASQFFKGAHFDEAKGTLTLKQPDVAKAILYRTRMAMDESTNSTLPMQIVSALKQRPHFAVQINTILGETIVSKVKATQLDSVLSLHLVDKNNVEEAARVIEEKIKLSSPITRKTKTLEIEREDVDTFLKATDILLPISCFTQEQRTLFLYGQEPTPRTFTQLTKQSLGIEPKWRNMSLADLKERVNAFLGKEMVLGASRDRNCDAVVLKLAPQADAYALWNEVEKWLSADNLEILVTMESDGPCLNILGTALETLLKLTETKKQETWVERSSPDPLTKRLLGALDGLEKRMNTLLGKEAVLEVSKESDKQGRPILLVKLAQGVDREALYMELNEKLSVVGPHELVAFTEKDERFLQVSGKALESLLNLTEPKKEGTWAERSHSPQRQAAVSTPGAFQC